MYFLVILKLFSSGVLIASLVLVCCWYCDEYVVFVAQVPNIHMIFDNVECAIPSNRKLLQFSLILGVDLPWLTSILHYVHTKV